MHNYYGGPLLLSCLWPKYYRQYLLDITVASSSSCLRHFGPFSYHGLPDLLPPVLSLACCRHARPMWRKFMANCYFVLLSFSLSKASTEPIQNNSDFTRRGSKLHVEPLTWGAKVPFVVRQLAHNLPGSSLTTCPAARSQPVQQLAHNLTGSSLTNCPACGPTNS